MSFYRPFRLPYDKGHEAHSQDEAPPPKARPFGAEQRSEAGQIDGCQQQDDAKHNGAGDVRISHDIVGEKQRSRSPQVIDKPKL